MAFKDKQTRKERLSSVVAGDTRRYGGGRVTRSDFAGNLQQGYGGGGLGMPVANLGANIKPSDIPAMPAPTGEETVRKTVTLPKPKIKPAQVISTTVRERITPVSATAAAPTRMAVNRATGDTTGFTTGKTTGKTVTKPGTAYKTPMTGLQRMNQNAFNKGGVAGPSRSTGGSKSAGPSRSTGGTRASNPSRGDVGAGRRGGGR